MLSLFPSLFDYNVIAVGVLRVCVAIIFIIEGYKKFPKTRESAIFYKKIIPTIELVGGILLFIGLFTQAASTILGAVAMKNAYLERRKESDKEKRTSFYFLLFVASLSFLFLGPGLWSIDYPL